VDDFELCREIKEKGRPARFEVLAKSTSLKDSGLTGWGTVFLQFRDRQTGDLLPINYTLPPLNEDDHEVPFCQVMDIKGKRRASVELDESTLDF